MSQEVLANVNGRDITKEEVNLFIQAMGPQGMQFRTPEGMNRITDELVNQELIYLDAQKKKLEENESFQKELQEELARVKEAAIKRFAINELLKDVTVSEEELKSYYEEHPENYRAKETIKAKHILVDNRELAEKILEEIRQGKTFDEAAKEYSTCPSAQSGGFLGEFGRGQMVKEFEDVAFEAPVNEVVGPVHTEFGEHLVLVTEKSEAELKPFEEVKDAIQGLLMAKKQQEIYLEKTKALQEEYEVKKYY